VDFVGPLAKAKLLPEDIVQAYGINFSASAGAKEAGIPPGVYPLVPPLEILKSPPFDLVEFTDRFKIVNIATCNVTFKVKNEFPFPISKGSKLLIREGDQVLFVLELNRQIEGDGDSLSQTFTLEKLRMSSTLNIILADFYTPGVMHEVTIDAQRLYYTISIHDIIIESMELTSGGNIDLNDTTDFVLRGDVVNTELKGGTIDVFIDNELPIRFQIQGYFLGEDKKQVLDSLFDNSIEVMPAETDVSGTVLASKQSKLPIFLSPDKVQRIKNARWFVALGRIQTIQTPSGSAFVQKGQGINITLNGDIRFNINGKTE
jgi:hypothetical protein